MNTYGNKNEPFRQEAFENTLSSSLSEQNKINIYDPLYLLNRFLNTETTFIMKRSVTFQSHLYCECDWPWETELRLMIPAYNYRSGIISSEGRFNQIICNSVVCRQRSLSEVSCGEPEDANNKSIVKHENAFHSH